MRDEFLATLAHDMGGALGAIMGYASILEDSEQPLTPDQARCLTGILAGSEQLDRLIGDLRAYASRPAPDPGAP